jgi:hypothetical protein
MHWLIEALIWSGLAVACNFGYILMRSANALGKNEKANKIELLQAFFLGLFITSFCIVYAFFRFFIVLNYALPTDIR